MSEIADDRFKISAEMADDMRLGAVLTGDFGRHGLRKITRMWFNPASGNYIVDAGAVWFWAGQPNGPWTSFAVSPSRQPEAKP